MWNPQDEERPRSGSSGVYVTKALRLARSGVHDWGLYAEEAIGADEFVIEYAPPSACKLRPLRPPAMSAAAGHPHVPAEARLSSRHIML